MNNDKYKCFLSKIMKVLLEIFKTHLILINFSILETIFDLIQSYFPTNELEHYQNIFRHQIALPLLNLLLLLSVKMVEQIQ